MEPKSWITTPGSDGQAVKAGRAVVRGVAFGGMHAVKRVDVSIDGGKTWKQAALIGPDLASTPGASSRCRSNCPRASTC